MFDLWLPGITNRRAIAGTDISQSQQNIDYPAPKLAVVIPKLRADAPFVCSRVESCGPPSFADVHNRFVDEKSVVPAHKPVDTLDPRGIVDQPLEGLAHLEHLVKMQLRRDVRGPSHPTPPLARLHVLVGIDDRV